jgi:hypothetical protein
VRVSGWVSSSSSASLVVRLAFGGLGFVFFADLLGLGRRARARVRSQMFSRVMVGQILFWFTDGALGRGAWECGCKEAEELWGVCRVLFGGNCWCQ